MSSIVQVKRYFEAGKHGRRVNLQEEIKPLAPEEKAELCAELDKLTEQEREQ